MTKEIVASLEALLDNEAPPNDDLGDREYFLRVGRIEAFEKCIAAVKEAAPCACRGEPVALLERLARDTADKYGGFASIDMPVDQAVVDYLAVAWSPEIGYDYQTGAGDDVEEDKKHLTREEAVALLSKLLSLPVGEA